MHAYRLCVPLLAGIVASGALPLLFLLGASSSDSDELELDESESELEESESDESELDESESDELSSEDDESSAAHIHVGISCLLRELHAAAMTTTENVEKETAVQVSGCT